MDTYYIISQRFRFSVWVWICRLAGGTLRRICWATNEFIAICNSVLLHFSLLVWLHLLLLALNCFACMVLLVIAAVVKGLYLSVADMLSFPFSALALAIRGWSLPSAIRYPMGLFALINSTLSPRRWFSLYSSMQHFHMTDISDHLRWHH
jgi:hypothetical protein